MYIAYAVILPTLQYSAIVWMPHHGLYWRHLHAVALACSSSVEELARAASYHTRAAVGALRSIHGSICPAYRLSAGGNQSTTAGAAQPDQQAVQTRQVRTELPGSAHGLLQIIRY